MEPDQAGSSLTTLLDESIDPATSLAMVYHERWEVELAIDELKTHQRERPVLRSRTPAGVVQEVYRLLTAHGLVRRLMVDAARRAGVAPRRVSLTGTLKIVRCRLAEGPATPLGRRKWYELLLKEVAEELIPERSNRVNPRVIRKPVSKWPKKQTKHHAKRPKLNPFQETITIFD